MSSDSASHPQAAFAWTIPGVTYFAGLLVTFNFSSLDGENAMLLAWLSTALVIVLASLWIFTRRRHALSGADRFFLRFAPLINYGVVALASAWFWIHQQR